MNEDKLNQKIIMVAFLVSGGLVGLSVDVLFEMLAATLAAVAKLRGHEVVKHGLPVMVGIVTFAYLQFNARIQLWAEEVVSEIRKVVWPTRKDTVGMTIVCCVLVVVAGLGLGLLDFVSGQFIKLFAQ